MFTARYGLSPYITQKRLVFKRLLLCVLRKERGRFPATFGRGRPAAAQVGSEILRPK